MLDCLININSYRTQFVFLWAIRFEHFVLPWVVQKLITTSYICYLSNSLLS